MRMGRIGGIWSYWGLNRRDFLRKFGIAAGSLSLSLVFGRRLKKAMAQTSGVKVYMAKNGDCFQNTAKIWELLGGPSKYIDPTDIVIIKANGQWPNQGYTHTGCINGDWVGPS